MRRAYALQAAQAFLNSFSTTSRSAPVRFWILPSNSSSFPNTYWRSSSVRIDHFCFSFAFVMAQLPLISWIFISNECSLVPLQQLWGITLLLKFTKSPARSSTDLKKDSLLEEKDVLLASLNWGSRLVFNRLEHSVRIWGSRHVRCLAINAIYDIGVIPALLLNQFDDFGDFSVSHNH